VAAGDEKRPRYRTYRAAGAETETGDPIAERAKARAAAPPPPPAPVAPADSAIIQLPEPGTGTPPRRPSKAPPRGPRRRRFRRKRWLIGVPALLLLLLVAYVGYGYWELRTSMQRANDRMTAKTRAALTPGGSLWGSASTILVLGSDARPGDTSSRSDSILLIRTDPSRQQIEELSIPRDLRTEIPGYQPTKINAAYSYGGAPLAIATIENLTGIKVNHLVLVDFGGFEKLIDVLGGVTIVNPEKIISNEFDGYVWHFGKGTLHLDGRHALAYSRVRENTLNPNDNDITRGQRQQRVLTALAARLGSPDTLLHLPKVGDALGEPLTTDLSASDLVALGWDRFRSSRTLHCRLGGEGTSIGGQYELIGSEQNRQTIEEFLGQSAPQAPDPSSDTSPGCTTS
jgi:polyisoprenyl-teichoic acid--peptidoglycan teichoic acid transferase